MATVVFSGGDSNGGFNMGLWDVGFLLSLLTDTNTSASGNASQATFTNPLTFGGPTTLIAQGSFSNYNANGPQSGTITSFQYTTYYFTMGVPVTMSVTGLSLSVASLNTWALTYNPAALQAALFGGNDTFTGTQYRDVLLGYGGDDTLDGGAGADELAGGLGNDTYVVDDINDRVAELSGEGTDTIRTTLNTYALNDFGDGQVENLTFIGTGAFNATGNNLNNVITGGGGNDTLNGDGGNDHLIGGAGDDTLSGGSGTDTLDGGDGSDTVSYAYDYIGFGPISLEAGGAAGYGDTFISIENVIGSNVSDFIYGNGVANSIWGGTGDDTIFGRAGDDFLDGDIGNDSLLGEDGHDRLFGGAGLDTINGGAGIDTAIYAVASTSAIWHRNEAGHWTVSAQGVDFVINVEFLEFTDRSVHLAIAADNFFGDGTSDILLRRNDGVTAIWDMSGATVSQSNVTQWQAPSDWAIQGLGDFNGDGRDDFLLRRVSDGVTSIWSMNGFAVQAADVTQWQAGLEWRRFQRRRRRRFPLAAHRRRHRHLADERHHRGAS